MKENCLFCKISNNIEPSFKIYEDDIFLVFLDVFPMSLGHVLLIPKKHSNDISSTEDLILEKYGPLLKKITRAIDKTFNPDGLTIRTNIRSSGGQIIFHTHLHIIPIYDNPIEKIVDQTIADKINENL